MIMYLEIKTAHMSLAVLSISFFIVRAYWSWLESPRLMQTWVKVAPHCIDTLLLGCGVTLMILSGQYPTQHSWLAAKLIALLLYIIIGTIAIKRGRTRQQRLGAAFLATTIFIYMLGVAQQRSVLSWVAS